MSAAGGLMTNPADQPEERPAWVFEQERAIDRLRVRVHELETTAEVERDAIVPYGIASAGVFALLVSLTLPWVIRTDTGQAGTGWALLLAPLSAPVAAGGVVLVLVTALLQVIGLLGRQRGAALLATVATTIAGLGATTVLFTIGRDPSVDAGTGAMLCLLILLVLGIAWASITEGRRWTV
jgi:hypothetical protein